VLAEQLEGVVDIDRVPLLKKFKGLLGLGRLVPLDAPQKLRR